MRKSTIISGKIINREVYPNTKEIELVMPDFEGNETDIFAEINEKGEYRLEFFPKTKREIKLIPIEEILVIGPGDSLYVEKDFKDIGSVKYSGDGAALNAQISKYGKFFLRGYGSDYKMSTKEFQQYCIAEREKYYEQLKEFQQSQNITNELVSWTTSKIELQYSQALLDYPWYHFRRTKEIFTDSTEYYSFVDKVPKLFNSQIIASENFKIAYQLLWPELKILRQKYAENIAMKDTTVNNLIEKELISSTDTSHLSQFKLAAFFANTMYQHLTVPFDRNRTEIEEKITDPFLKITLNDYFERVNTYNKNPKVTSDALLGNTGNFEITNRISLNQPEGKNLVKEIIDGNPNKVIYMDIWSMGCPPCLTNMPYFKKLMKEFEGKPVEFVFINLDNDIEAWQKKIKELELGGKHYRCDPAEARVFLKRFNYPGVPFQLLVNKKGVIVDYGYHVVPQNDYTRQTIERLLAEK
jgi:thiol-disulfide isomerase/thioredoxin